ncbi:MAG: RdgB/HAM1 family non-canonical purine NTP pyrophosphatase [Phycisphaerae bacterium]|nr:RdgB/HAM1 family non-canonical purine NTP pyrophosphatase [Phycisphaerae bacterium]
MEIVAATGNPHKLEEIRAVLEPIGFRVRSLVDAGDAGPEPVESGDAFEANAAIKAIAYARRLGAIVLADDSGLEVDLLNGEPGVHSAHWAGSEGSRAERDARNNARLLAALAGVPVELRSARFVCTLCVAAPDGSVLLEARGELEGRIAETPRGEHGFGYDPLFVVPEFDRTSAELAPAEKNEISHRGRALRRLAFLLRHKGILVG